MRYATVAGRRRSVRHCTPALRAAIYLRRGEGHRVHHKFLHHNQRQGLGYGVCHDVAESEITHNLFDWNRHSIAGTWMRVERNAFLCARTALKVRGVPEREARFTGNWCVHAGPSAALSDKARTVAGGVDLRLSILK